MEIVFSNVMYDYTKEKIDSAITKLDEKDKDKIENIANKWNDMWKPTEKETTVFSNFYYWIMKDVYLGTIQWNDKKIPIFVDNRELYIPYDNILYQHMLKYKLHCKIGEYSDNNVLEQNWIPHEYLIHAYLDYFIRLHWCCYDQNKTTYRKNLQTINETIVYHYRKGMDKVIQTDYNKYKINEYYMNKLII